MVLDVANICEKDEERKKTRSSFNIVRCDNRNLYFRLYEMLITKISRIHRYRYSQILRNCRYETCI